MSSHSNYYTTKSKASITTCYDREECNSDDCNVPVGAVTNSTHNSQHRMLSKSFGGRDSSRFLQGAPSVPQGNPLLRYSTDGCSVSTIKHSGYLYKRSNNPHLNPSELILSSASATKLPQLFPQGHNRERPSWSGKTTTTPTASSTIFVGPSMVPEFPEMPGVFARSTLAARITVESNHIVRDSVGLIENHHAPRLDKITITSPLSHQQDEHVILMQQHQPTPMTAAVSSRNIVTPSPMNASDYVSMGNDPNVRRQETQQPTAAQYEQKADKSEKKNPLQLVLETVAAFFGTPLDGKKRTDTEGDSDEVQSAIVASHSMEDHNPKMTIESTSDTTTPLFSSSSLPKISSAPIKVASIGNGGTTASRPIPSHGGCRESFHEANHRRYSAPTEIALSSSENSLSELNFKLQDSKCNARTSGIPQDYYDLKDGHLWRAKYCVLENGILYFYRNANDGESSEAVVERKRSPVQLDKADPGKPITATAPPLQRVGESPASAVDTSISRRRISAQDLSKSPMPVPVFHRLLSNGSSDTGSFMWEKRVSMDCVGGVRTAEKHYGPNSFELIALVDDDFDQAQVNTLVLQACNAAAMKEWIFQFHRSLASFVRNIMDGIGSTSNNGDYLDIHHPTSMFPEKANRHASASSSETFDLGFVPQSPPEKQPPLHYAASPRFQNSHLSAHQYLSMQQSLSHGHGRTSLKRITDVKAPENGTAYLSSTPERSDTDSPQHLFAFREPSPNNGSRSPEVISPPTRFLIPPPTNGSKTAASNTKKTVQQSSVVSTTLLPDDSKPPGPLSDSPRTLQSKPSSKDIPPQPQKMYVPPHKRQRDVKPDGSQGGVSTSAGSLAEIARATSPKNELSESSRYESSEQLDVVGPSAVNFVRGGCADPRLIQGSILDQMYIPKDASRVGKVATPPFGSFGGGRAKSATRTSGIESSLRWETGAVSQCGGREYNEDAYLISNDLLSAFKEGSYGQPQTLWKQEDADHTVGLFAVFDGHQGNQAARFAVESLAHFIHVELQTVNNNNEHAHSVHGGNDDESPFSPSTVESVLRDAMIKMDDRFCQLCHEDERKWDAGATALVAMIVNEHLVIANLGDCRGVLCRFVEDNDSYETDVSWSELPTIAEDELSSERASDYRDSIATQRCFWKEVTTVHSPSAATERIRIEEANGWITTEIEIPIAQLGRMDFSDEEVYRILQRCFNFFEGNNESAKSDSERSVKECKAAPQRILHISRVCGELAVSRALGDRDFKAAFNLLSSNDANDVNKNAEAESDVPLWWDSPFFLTYPEDEKRRFKGDLVSNTPDFQKIKVGDKGISGEFLLLACDGLWDVMDYDDAVRVARDLLFRKRWTAKKAAARLAELAMHLGSSDNVTVVLVRLFSGTVPDGN